MSDKTINLQVIKSFEPCVEGLENFIKHHKDFSGTALELLELENVPAKDKFWLLLREEFIPENDLHELACKFAESVLHLFEKEYPNDLRLRKAIEAKRKFIKGEISKDELAAARAAASAAAWDAARAAASAAARAAASAARYAARAAADAASDAASAATWAAARGDERQKQLEIVKEYFNER